MKRSFAVVISIVSIAGVTATTGFAPAVHAAAAKQPHKHKKKHKKKQPNAGKAQSALEPTGNFNSCSVVTQAEAASALGQSVGAGILGHATVEGGLACVFYGPSVTTPTTPNVAQADTVRVVVVEGSDASTWYQSYKASVNAQAITGFGTQAYYDGYASLSVLKGDYYLRVAVVPAAAPPSLSAEEQLANAILPKL